MHTKSNTLLKTKDHRLHYSSSTYHASADGMHRVHVELFQCLGIPDVGGERSNDGDVGRVGDVVGSMTEALHEVTQHFAHLLDEGVQIAHGPGALVAALKRVHELLA